VRALPIRVLVVDDRTALEKWILRSWREDAAQLPAFPLVATRLVNALEQPDIDVDDVRVLISQDPAITSQVIRAANSAYYSTPSPVEDVRGAIMRLGFKEISNVAMAAACRSLFTMEDRAELEVFPSAWGPLWANSLVGAYGARLIASELKMGDPAKVFLASVFRDVGSLLILKLVAAGMVDGRLRGRPSEEELAGLLTALHEQLGGEYLRRNQLPDYAVQIAEQHHCAELVFAHDTVNAHVVRVADGLCDRVGIPPFASQEMGPASAQSAELLGLDDDRLDYFALQIEGLREQLSEMLDTGER
jgi:HD-like signal output (HDOD) protein